MSDCITLAQLGALLAILAPIVGLLYRDARKSTNDQIADLIDQRDKLLAQVSKAEPVLEEAKATVRQAGGRRRG